MKFAPPEEGRSAQVEVRDGRVRLLVDGEPVAPLFYGLTDCPGARWTWEEVPARQLRLFAATGIRLFQVDLWAEHVLDPDGAMNLDRARRQVRGVLDQCPDAAVMIRFHLNPPPSWCREHPAECVGYLDAEPEDTALRWGMLRPLAGDLAHPLRASFSSKVWRAWVDEMLGEFCECFGREPEGKAVISLQLAYGVYGEWHQFGFLEHDSDTGSSAVAAFRAWLRATYRDEEALRSAWNDPTASFDNALPPSSAERETAAEGILRDPARQRGIIDYFTWFHESLGDAITGFAAVAKRRWPRPLLTAVFYGYFHSMFGRQAAGGHLALDRVLASPHVDALCAPTSYTEGARNVGGSGHSRGLPDAARRAGKLWLDEMDQATNVGCPWIPEFRSTVDDDIAVQRRNILQIVMRGGGAWWYDFGPVAGCDWRSDGGTRGWWDHPRLLEDARAIQAITREKMRGPYTRPADVLVVHDPWSFCHTVAVRQRRQAASDKLDNATALPGDPLASLLTDELTETLHRTGVIHSDALLGELATMDLAPYRVVILATTPVLNAAMRKVIETHVRRDGRELWCLGFCGWSDGERLGADLMTDVTGMRCRLLPVGTPPVMISEWERMTLRRELHTALAVPSVEDSGAELLARWEAGGVAAARITDAAGTRLWWGVPPVGQDASLLRAHLQRAGCHVINDHDDTTLLGAGLLLLHTLEGGERTLRLPGGRVIQAMLPARSTSVYDAATGELLLQ